MAEQHPGIDALADLLATDSAASDPHVAGCATCRTRAAELTTALVPVAASLASLPVPPVPADLDSRLTTAIDQLRATQGRAAAGRDVTRIDRRRTPQRLAWLPIAGGLAAAAALVFAVVVVNDGGGPSTSTDATTTAEAVTRTSSTGLGYARDGKLLATELPALLTGTAGPSDRAVADTGSTQAPREQAAPKAASADPLDRLRTTSGLASCLAGLTKGERDQLPLALDYAAFERQPALVVVLASAKPDKVDVFVVGAGCTQADDHLLYFSRLTAPARSQP